ncbi:SH3 domain-containing protein [Campylobacter sp. RKI_CA19_01128]|uniref:SH3 domain-containing protein n=1 Tax=unclassified Campylobacter TaxID=2593542 RepID=UPI0021E915F9|nr:MULTISPECIES: SH3 domain-containing protein [unclassified Campylobacter]HEC1753080.1 SH3 domain-containing protein [Campylobacter lari]MCV3349612.1 SH3 domain-containing protein [Campylobacter sp. RKI_CA19_01127]MCV3355591.1 SH3 domain-containing protein [Campylobacter sp. RKI_CA19_01128]HEC1776323.1 SH3 domain-containing protein [Campylobacter lari]HEF1622525.1 SH3 domain-containing protein [Campylobacter lari]
MLKTFKVFCVFLLAFNLYAQENSVFEDYNTLEKNYNQLDDQAKQIYQTIAPSDESNYESKINDENFIPQGSLVLNAKEYTDEAFIDEAFAIDLEVITTTNVSFDLNVSFEKNDDMLWINPNPIWEQKANSYHTKLWFEAKSLNANLNKIIVSLSRNDHIFQSSSLIIKPIRLKKIDAPSNKYSHIVASNLEVKQVKASHFDNDNMILFIELAGENTNLASFNIKDIQKQGVEAIKGDFEKQSGFYYAILDKSKTRFDFSYFNLNSKELKDFSLKIELKEDSISTQSDLNPKTNDFNFYKQVFLWSLCGIFALWFVFKKSYVALGLAILALIASFLAQNNIYKAILKAESKVQILPTLNSTHFYSGKYNQEVEVLDSRDEYKKILFNNGKIGWVKSEDLSKI